MVNCYMKMYVMIMKLLYHRKGVYNVITYIVWAHGVFNDRCPNLRLFPRLQISYSGVRSFDPSVPLQRPGLMVSLPSNATHNLFSQLHPGVTYQLSIRASTSKGFGPATTLNVTTNISGEIEPLISK